MASPSPSGLERLLTFFDSGTEIFKFGAKSCTHFGEGLCLFLIDVILHRLLQQLDKAGEVVGLIADLLDQALGLFVLLFGMLLKLGIDLRQAGIHNLLLDRGVDFQLLM